MGTSAAAIAHCYRVFGGYPLPARLWICPQCAPDRSAAELARTPLRALSFADLDAVHVMSLDDDALRHFFPRLIELLLVTPAPVFDFRAADLKARIAGWSARERAAVAALAEAVWAELIEAYPAPLGYCSDCPSALELLDWTGLPWEPQLDELLTSEREASARHLADLVDYSFESSCGAELVEWVSAAAVGVRLQEAFFTASSAEEADQISAAHQLWTLRRA